MTTPIAWLGLVCCTLQIYFGFSGHSDMAIGLMRMFGFCILENFNCPYISRSVREFWRHWHISLSNWFCDYLHPARWQSTRRVCANLVIVFLLCGCSTGTIALFHGRRRSIDRNYRGMFPISNADIAAAMTELRRRRRFLASLGIAYVATIGPEKYTIYPEHLPLWVAKGDALTPLERLIAAISADGNVRFVDLRAPLRRQRSASASIPRLIRTGTCWAPRSVATRSCRKYKRALPEGRLPVIAPPVLPTYVAGVDVYSGDLARNLGLPPR